MAAVLLAPLASASPIGHGGAAGLLSGHECTIIETARQPLTLAGGQQLYVEPSVVAPSPEGGLLLLGNYAYLFQPAGGRWIPAPADSAMGAVVARSGAARIVNAPFPSKLLNGVRARARDDGGWDVAFAEVRPSADTARSDTVASLWYGVLEGGRWTTLERLPMPPDGVVFGNRFSSLVRWGDTLAWAVTQRLPGEPLASVRVYERSGSGWSSSVVPTTNAYIELLHHPATGLAVAVVQPDPLALSDRNSLLLWTRRPDWRIHGRIIRGRDEWVHAPSISMRGDGGVLTWEADVPVPEGGYRHEAHAMVGRIAERNEPVLRLDSLAMPMRPISFLDFSGDRRAWMVEHGAPGAARAELRFVGDRAGRAGLLGSMPSPYVTRAAAAAVSPSEAVVSGGVITHGGDAVVTLLLRMRLECSETKTDEALSASASGKQGRFP